MIAPSAPASLIPWRKRIGHLFERIGVAHQDHWRVLILGAETSDEVERSLQAGASMQSPFGRAPGPRRRRPSDRKGKAQLDNIGAGLRSARRISKLVSRSGSKPITYTTSPARFSARSLAKRAAMRALIYPSQIAGDREDIFVAAPAHIHDHRAALADLLGDIADAGERVRRLQRGNDAFEFVQS